MDEFRDMFIEVFQRRWCLDIIAALGAKPLRFTKLQHAIGRVRPEFPHAAVLQKALRVLEERGYIEHVLDPAAPVYRLTELGATIGGKIVEMNQWCREHSGPRSVSRR